MLRPAISIRAGSPPPSAQASKKSSSTATARLAIAFPWHGDPEHSRLKAAGQGIVNALAPLQDRIKLLLLMIDGDVGKTFGRLMHRELNWPGKIVSIDGVELQELDYVDVGELIAPPGVVPVVIKSLLFA